GDVLDGGDQEHEVGLAFGKRDVLNRTPVDEKAPAARGLDRPVARVDAFEGPSRAAVFPQELQVEAVAAPDIQDPGLGSERPAARQQALRLQAATNLVDEPELPFREVERVIVDRIDATQIAGVRPRIQVDQAATPAADGQEAVRARAILEVLSHRDRIRVLDPAEAAPGGHEGQGTRKTLPAGHSGLDLRNVGHPLPLRSGPRATTLNSLGTRCRGSRYFQFPRTSVRVREARRPRQAYLCRATFIPS